MPYLVTFIVKLEEQLEKLEKKDPVLYRRIIEKAREVSFIPNRGKPLRNKMSGIWEVHVGHFVLFYRIHQKIQTVEFLSFEHKDRAYTR